jgi:hypothetical protein
MQATLDGGHGDLEVSVVWGEDRHRIALFERVLVEENGAGVRTASVVMYG